MHLKNSAIFHFRGWFGRCSSPWFNRCSSPWFSRCSSPWFSRCSSPWFNRCSSPWFGRCSNPWFSRWFGPCFCLSFWFCFWLYLGLPLPGYSQKGPVLFDARSSSEAKEFQAQLDQRPPEVQFGITVLENGDIFFSCNNKTWLSNLLNSDSYGITSDIISKDIYVCGVKGPDSTQLIKGTVLVPVYRPDLFSHPQEGNSGIFSTRLGNSGHTYFDKEVEGNLFFIVENRVLASIKFINLDRSPFHILPMGLFTDTLIQSKSNGEGEKEKGYSYSKSVQITVPFPKARADFKPSDFAPLNKALNLSEFQIENIEIRAYSSVEGNEAFNDTLMKKRAESMLQEIKKTQPQLNHFNILTAENWLEFFESIKSSEFKDWSGLSKKEIKIRLLDKTLAPKLEPLLAGERKAVVTVFLNKRTLYHDLSETQLKDQFNASVQAKKVQKALLFEREIIDRIRDNKIPTSYLNQLEIPESVNFISLLNEQMVYSLLFFPNSEREALKRCLVLRKLDPNNGRLNYNIQALRLSLWEKENDPSGTESLLADIEGLGKQGIPPSLIKRMVLNNYILQTSVQMASGDYPGKNKSLQYIGDTYLSMPLIDQEIYSLARFFSFYGRMDLSKKLVETRIDKLDIDEDLLFYFLNLEFYDPNQFRTEIFRKGVLNAININRERFCKFFSPADKNGASIQLLDYSQLKKIYCESCTKSSE